MQLLNTITLATSLLSAISTAMPTPGIDNSTAPLTHLAAETAGRCLHPKVDKCHSKQDNVDKVRECVIDILNKCVPYKKVLLELRSQNSLFMKDLALGWEYCDGRTFPCVNAYLLEHMCKSAWISAAVDRIMKLYHDCDDLDFIPLAKGPLIEVASVEGKNNNTDIQQ